MGILDDAIRDHLELKRKGGAQETDLKRLEDEAFGPPSRPGDAAAAVAEMPEMPEALKREPSQPEAGDEPPAVPEPEFEAPKPAPSEGGGEKPAEAEVGGAFHDFAAEEGLVSPRAEAPAAPAEAEVAREPEEATVEEPDVEEPEREQPAPEASPPAREASLDDTQPHDMQAELGAVEEPAPAPEEPPAEQSSEFGIADEDLELGFEDDEEQRPSGDLRVVEEDEELVVEEVDVEEVAEGDDAEGEDVLEETPEFLRETPEHDRLWFEQRPPKDFDFDE